MNGIFCLSVCLSVRLSVRTPFWLCSHHRISWNFQELSPRTRVTSMQKVKVRGQRSRSQVTTQLDRFRTVTPVWIHIWWWNDAYSLMLLRRGALLFFKVIRHISRSHGSKNCEYDLDWAFPDCNSSFNSPMATKWCTKLEIPGALLFFKVIRQISRSHGSKNRRIWPKLGVSGL